jgi:Tol biopolymer transport system component
VAVLCLAAPGIAQAAFPGENGKIAFERGGDIYTIDPDGSGAQQVTSTGNNSEPAWSANGRRIAFTSTRDGNSEVYVMDERGGGQTNVTNDPAPDSHPAWSPTGDRITFERFTPDAGWDVYVMNAGGGGVTNITDASGSGPAETGVDPVWSPDGTRIAFVRGNNITLINPDGTGLTALTHYPIPTRDSHTNSYDPTWSPDGQWIAFMRISGGGPLFFYELLIIRSDGTESWTTYLNVSNGEGAWSPDGREIVLQGNSSLERIDISAPDFPRVPPTAPIPNTSFGDHTPDWQPLVPEPQRGDYKNSAKFCKALQQFLGDGEFASRYKNLGGCVSRRGA